jgi:hypothetical protein
VPTVILHDPPGYREADAGASGAPLAGLIRAVEAFEYVR